MLCSGLEPAVRHHYRADKMALWLGLVPRLHRATGSASAAASGTAADGGGAPDAADDVRYHRLEDEDNFFSFEDENDYESLKHQQRQMSSNRKSEYDDRDSSTADKTVAKKYIAADSLEPVAGPVPDANGPSTGGGRKSARRTSTPFRHATTTTIMPPQVAVSVAERSIVTSSHLRRQPKHDESASASGAEQQQHQQHHIALIATIATGCGALVLNCLVFAAVCVHRARLTRRSKSSQMSAGGAGYDLPPPPRTALRTFAAPSGGGGDSSSNHVRRNCGSANSNCSSLMRNHGSGAPTNGFYDTDLNMLPTSPLNPYDADAARSSDPLRPTSPQSPNRCSATVSTPSSSWQTASSSNTLPPPPPRRTSASMRSPTSSNVDCRPLTDNMGDANHCYHNHNHQQQQHPETQYLITTQT